ncbi:MAG: hypothetical protein ABI355_03210 [Solirubrobacteraceae bacterium]
MRDKNNLGTYLASGAHRPTLEGPDATIETALMSIAPAANYGQISSPI